MFFGKKDEKLEFMKNRFRSRAAYAKAIEDLQLTEDEKMIFQRAFSQLKKDKPDIAIVHQAYDTLMMISMGEHSVPAEKLIDTPIGASSTPLIVADGLNKERHSESFVRVDANMDSRKNKSNLLLTKIVFTLFAVGWLVVSLIGTVETSKAEGRETVEPISTYGFTGNDAIVVNEGMLDICAHQAISMSDLKVLVVRGREYGHINSSGQDPHEFIEEIREYARHIQGLKYMGNIDDINVVFDCIRLIRMGSLQTSRGGIEKQMAEAATAASITGRNVPDIITERTEFALAKSAAGLMSIANANRLWYEIETIANDPRVLDELNGR